MDLAIHHRLAAVGAIAMMGICSGVGHLLLLQAYRYALPSVVSPSSTARLALPC